MLEASTGSRRFCPRCALAVRHRDYGVEADQYGLVGLAPMETLRELLGKVFDGELEQAWRDVYAQVATTMIDAALGPRLR